MGPAHEKTMAPSSKKERAYTNPLLTESKQGNRGATAISLVALWRYPLVARIQAVAGRECGLSSGGAALADRVCGARVVAGALELGHFSWGGSTFSRGLGNFNWSANGLRIVQLRMQIHRAIVRPGQMPA